MGRDRGRPARADEERPRRTRRGGIPRVVVMVVVMVAVMIAGLSGCNPKIKDFVVTPQGYCSTTQKIHVTWSTEHGDTTIKVEPPNPAPRQVSSSGTLDVAPQPMTLTLTVDDGRRHEIRTINVRPVDKHALDGQTTDCTDGRVTTDPFTFGGGSGAFDPDARLAVIVNRCAPDADAHATCRRKVEVRHGAHTWSIDPDSALDVSAANARVEGDWVLTGQLLPDEACGTPSAVAAQELTLSIEMNCDGGSS